ncbi:MAG TPA: nitroreductase family protein [Candidatus Hydrogenedentes bacterium]|nr:nitroreductase family protein [Candidatus Hydrogenedentota bacterium]
MHVFDAIEQRRSVKKFDPAHRMPEPELRRLLELAMLSPTAFNIQNWRFMVVQDPELRRKIRTVAWDQAQVTDASALIIVCADLKAWEKDPGRYWRNAAPEVQQMLVGMIDAYYRGKDQVQRDEAMRSCGIAAQTLMLAAKAMGYDTCPMDGFDFDAVAELIGLPPDHVISMMIAVGKPLAPAWPRSGPIAYEEAVIINRFA